MIVGDSKVTFLPDIKPARVNLCWKLAINPTVFFRFFFNQVQFSRVKIYVSSTNRVRENCRWFQFYVKHFPRVRTTDHRIKVVSTKLKWQIR